jgi:hypothetical protein
MRRFVEVATRKCAVAPFRLTTCWGRPRNALTGQEPWKHSSFRRVVALAEIGDKTQLLALLLAARYPHRPGLSCWHHGGHAREPRAGRARWAAGSWRDRPQHALDPGLSFIAMAVWTLIPDSAPEESTAAPRFGVLRHHGGRLFLVEMGDKTQVPPWRWPRSTMPSYRGAGYHRWHDDRERPRGVRR